MSTSANTSGLLGIVEVSVGFCKEIADSLAALDPPARSRSRNGPGKSSGAFSRSQDFYAKLPNPVVDLTMKEVISAIRLFCQHGVTLFGASTLTTLPADTVARAWHLCQLLSERYTSWYCRHHCAFARTMRQWDDLSPWDVGTVHQVATHGRWGQAREVVVIGEPCPACVRGRLVLLAHPHMDCAGVCCNAGCRDSGAEPYAGILGQEVRGGTRGKTTDESAIWCEPDRPQGVDVFLPYQQLGCPVV